jgi:hypothetical protein
MERPSKEIDDTSKQNYDSQCKIESSEKKN